MSTNAKHTPGPWKVDATVALGAYGVWTEYGTHPRDISGQLYASQICSVYPNNVSHFDRDARDANALLIAAAPELLEACNDVLQFFDDSREDRYPIIGRVKAAVKKATGEKP